MCSCGCGCCGSGQSGRNTYVRRTNQMPQIGWCGRHQHITPFSFKTNGSYAGRNRS